MRGASLVVTDGVFSMDGYIAPLDELCAVAEKHGALVMVDDSHAAGILGATGAGTPELFGVRDRVDLVSGTLGKALGGASGGYVSGRGPLIELLRQRARPYLFSNAVPPMVVAGLAGGPRHRTLEGRGRGAREPGGERGALPRPDDRCRLRAAAGRAPDRAGHDPGCRGGRRDGGPAR